VYDSFVSRGYPAAMFVPLLVAMSNLSDVDGFTLHATHSDTLGVVGVERGASETTRKTSKGRKIWAWCICDAQNASAEPDISVEVCWKWRGL